MSLFAGLTVVMTWPLVMRLPTSLPAGLADPLLNAWTLAWGADRIPHGLQGFWTPPAFYPYRGALAYSENLLGISVLVAPVQWLGGNLVLTYNVAFLLSFVVAGVGMYLLARQLTGRADAALIAAVAYAFFPYRAAQVTHLQVLTSGWLPVALWALHRFFGTGRPSMLAVFVAAFFVQVLSNTYSLVFSLLPIGGVIVLALVTRQCSARGLRRLAVAAIAGSLILVPIIRAYTSVWHDPSDPRDVVRYSANLSSFVHVTSEIWYSRWLSGPGPDEGNFFPGFTVLALTAVAAFEGRRRSQRHDKSAGRVGVKAVYASVALVAAVLCLGPQPHAWSHPIPLIGTPYRALLAMAPGFAVVRVPARFATVFLLSLSVLAAFGARRVLSWCSTNRSRRLVLLGLCAAVVADGYAGPLRTSDFALFRDKEEKAVYTSLRHQGVSPMLELPLVSLGKEEYGLVYQAVALFHRHPIVNGISRKRTPLQDWLGSTVSPFATPATVSDGVALLRGMGVEYLVVHPSLYRDRALGESTVEALGGVAGVVARWGSPEITVFRLAPMEEAAVDAGERVPGHRMSVTASVNSAELRFALDENVATRWKSGQPQNGSEWLEVAFDRPTDVSRLDLVLGGRSFPDYPRALEIEAMEEGHAAPRVVYAGSILPALGAGLRRDPEAVETRLPVRAKNATSLRLSQHGATNLEWWSVHELRVWQAQRARR